MTNETKAPAHTPLPWKCKIDPEEVTVQSIDGEFIIGSDRIFCSPEEFAVDCENMRLMAHCVNAYPELVEALQKVAIIRRDSGGIATRDLVNECVEIAESALRKVGAL